MSDVNCGDVVPGAPAPVHTPAPHVVHHAQPTVHTAWHAPVHHHVQAPATSHGFAHAAAPRPQLIASATTDSGHCLTTPTKIKALADGAGPAAASPLFPKGVVAGAGLGLAGLGGLAGAGLAALGKTPPNGDGTPPTGPQPPGPPIGTPFIVSVTPSSPPGPPTPVPEPASIVMFAAAVLVLAALGWLRRRRA